MTKKERVHIAVVVPMAYAAVTVGVFTQSSGKAPNTRGDNMAKRSAPRFGGYRIKIDEKLSEVTGFRKGSEVPPSEVTKGVWKYIKRNRLGGKTA